MVPLTNDNNQDETRPCRNTVTPSLSPSPSKLQFATLTTLVNWDSLCNVCHYICYLVKSTTEGAILLQSPLEQMCFVYTSHKARHLDLFLYKICMLQIHGLLPPQYQQTGTMNTEYWEVGHHSPLKKRKENTRQLLIPWSYGQGRYWQSITLTPTIDVSFTTQSA